MKATEESAIADYLSLESMCKNLSYPLAIFINIASEETFFPSYKGKLKSKMYAYAVSLSNDKVKISESSFI